MNKDITFGIQGIELLEFSFNTNKQVISENLLLRYDINLEHRVNLEMGRIFVISTFHIFCDELNTHLGKAEISCIYNVSNINDFTKDGKLQLPEDFMITLNSISLSTCRGVLFTLFRGTPLHNAVLPIVDPKNFTNNAQ